MPNAGSLSQGIKAGYYRQGGQSAILHPKQTILMLFIQVLSSY
jgi:hypothetical protein